VALALSAGRFGFATTSLRAVAELADGLDPALEGVDLWVTSTVDELKTVIH